MPTMLENASKFSQLKYLVLELTVSDKDAGNILSLASYLRAAPLVEKFELHVSSIRSFLFLDLFFILHVFWGSVFSIAFIILFFEAARYFHHELAFSIATYFLF